MKQGIIRKEIGSEFWDIPTCNTDNRLFPADTQWFISGTAALDFILRDVQLKRSVKKAGVPSWCCSCMIEPFLRAGMEVTFYPVYADENHHLCCDYTPVEDCDITLVLTYFGYDGLKTAGKPGGILIRDLTHSLFTTPHKNADYCFGSLRKWAGFWTGGYAWKQNAWLSADPIPPTPEDYLNRRAHAMDTKLEFLTGKHNSKAYLEEFEDAEAFLDVCGIWGSCQRDILHAVALDVEMIRTRRRENAAVLLRYLKDLALFPTLQQDDCPMFVPIILPDKSRRDALRRYLIGQEIYCPVHWPVSDLHVLTSIERYLYDHSLSIICDQRYDAADMHRIAKAILQWNG